MMRLTVLGSRGSVPVEGKQFQLFGGATSAYLLEAGEEKIFLDGGNGIVNAPGGLAGRVTVLITHPHADHLIGLPFFPYLLEQGREVTFYGATFDGLDIRGQLERQFSPPLWPVRLDSLPAEVSYRTVEGNFALGDVRVSVMNSSHPGGSTIYRLDYRDQSLVYATDFEHKKERVEELIRFSEGCDLLIYDGQYSSEEYPRFAGYGHSTAQEGERIKAGSGARRLLITHHAPGKTDEQLLEMERNLQTLYPEDGYARAGQVIEW